MGKSQIPPVTECIKSLKSGRLSPVYFICGEDNFMISKTLEEVTKAADKYIFSDFDKEVIWGSEDKNLSDVISLATAFPFSSEKKLIVVKDFDKFKDKKELASYLKSAPEFTIFVAVHNGAITAQATEPFKSLLQMGYIFEAKELKGKALVQWIVSYLDEREKSITNENAQMLVDIVGENRDIIEDQLQKIITFIAMRREVTHQDISHLAANMKEYSIYDLQNALGRKDRIAAFKYGMNLLDKGKEPVYIVFMLVRYFTTLSRVEEVMNQNLPPAVSAKALEVFDWALKDYTAAKRLYSDKQLKRAAEALLKADVSLKTSSSDSKTIISVLLGEILTD